MTGFEWLGSLTSLVELIGSLIPRRTQVPPTARAIKYTGMRVVRVLQPGNHWVWPFRSQIHTYDIMPRALELIHQDVTNTEGITYRVDASVVVSVFDDDESVIKAFFENLRVEEIVAAECVHVLCKLVSESTDADLRDRKAFDVRLTGTIRKRLRRYGVRTHRACVATLARGIPILMLGR